MPKSFTQAQKQSMREERSMEKQAMRDVENERRATQIKLTLQEKKEVLPAAPLSKKELRKQKREKSIANEANLETTLSTEDDVTLLPAVPVSEEGVGIYIDPATAPIESETPLVAPLVNVNNEFSPQGEYYLDSSMRILGSLYSEDRTQQAAIADAEQQAIIDAATEVEQSSRGSARVVQNHSTYCEGLRPFLLKLQKKLPDCTIIPGKISHVAQHIEVFELRLQRMVDEYTYKFVARSGRATQDVVISTSSKLPYTQEFLCETIESLLSEKLRQASSTTSALSDEICSSYNRTIHQERNSFWREQDRQATQTRKEREIQAKHEAKVAKQARILKTKGLDPASVTQCAERDVDILSGVSRGKHSMR